MHQLNSDEVFHYELLRAMSHARYFGADISEVLQAAASIEPGNMESFHQAFFKLAVRVNAQAEKIDSSKFPVSARDAFFRASNYFRCSDFYLHGNAADPRINDIWVKQTAAFDKAIALLKVPGKRMAIKADGFDVDAIFYPADGDASKPKPTLIIGNGYDGAHEEMLHVIGFAALERGYNVLSYDGPGQPSVRRNQNLGFITEWEKVVTPVVDYLVQRPEVDASKISLMGYSMGGWLAVRAAAFEHRLAAAIAIDGVYDVYETYCNALSPPLRAMYDKGDLEGVDREIMSLLKSGHAPTGLRWGIEQGMWSFDVATPSQFLEKTRSMTLEGISQLIECPVWIGEASADQFFGGQPEKVAAALGERGTYVPLTEEDGASHHCHVGATTFVNQLVLDWLQERMA